MARSTLTSKGQTTIPKEIRDFLNIHPGDPIDFIISKEGVLMRPASIDISELKGILPKPKKPVTLEAMDRKIRERAKGSK
jgi:antitoxin PrlF